MPDFKRIFGYSIKPPPPIISNKITKIANFCRLGDGITLDIEAFAKDISAIFKLE